MLDPISDVGVDSSVTIDTPIADSVTEQPIDDQPISDANTSNADENPEAADDSSDEQADETLDLEKELETEADPSKLQALVKKLRVATKEQSKGLKEFQSQSEQSAQATELYKELFAFDPSEGKPTAKGFAEKLYTQDADVAFQAMRDLAFHKDVNGEELGYKLLEVFGLDPHKLPELREFSQGKIQSSFAVQVPDSIPKEYAEAFKSLSKVNQEDVLYNLTELDDPDYKQAAMEKLADRQDKLDNQRHTAERQTQADTAFKQDVNQTVETQLTETYTNLMDSVKQNPAYLNVKLSSNAQVDALTKDSIIAQINALGDPKSVLAQQSAKSFQTLGIAVDMPKVEKLMQQIEHYTQVAVSAEKQGKLQGRNYSAQINEANTLKAQATAQALAYANRIFGQTLAKVSKQPDPKGAVPSTTGASNGFSPQPTLGVKTPAELDAMYSKLFTSN